MIVVFACGGSGGHIIPALAVAQKFASNNNTVFFIGNKNSLEEKLATRHNYHFFPINVQKLYREFTVNHLKFPFKFFYSVILSVKYLKYLAPQCVFCTGGFVSGPVALASLLLKIPLYFQESNSYPGLTTRLFASKIKTIFISFEMTRKYLRNANCINHGTPIVDRNFESSTFDYNSIGLKANTKKILILGGSQGSIKINSIIDQACQQILDLGYEIIWQTGINNLQKYRNKYRNTKGIYCFGFSESVRDYYRDSYIAVTRAGALTLKEMEVERLPAILIPLPTAAENHQYWNAYEQVKKGIAVLINQAQLSVQTLLEKINDLDSNYADFKSSLMQIPVNDSALMIYHSIINDVQAKERSC